MSMNDPVADMLTRIRNGLSRRRASVTMPASKLKLAIAQVLRDEGYITDCAEVGEGSKKELRITLKYYEGEAVIRKIERVSKPGLRIY